MRFSALASSLLTAGLTAAPVTASVTPPVGAWRWPLAGTPVVSRPFQPPPHPWAAGHRGVDLAAPPDSPVLAAGAGVVSFAGYVAGVGVVAVLHPGGLRTTYEPVAPTVSPGTAVAAGQPIGRLLPGHGDCGPARWCLHWGLVRGSVYLDPLTLVRRGPVRLLPLISPPAPAPAPRAMGVTLRRAPPPSAAPLRSTRRTSPSLLRGVGPAVVAATTAAAALAGGLARRRIGRMGRISLAGRRAWP